MKDTLKTKSIPLLNEFPVGIHPYIVDVVDVKVDGHYDHHVVGNGRGVMGCCAHELP